MFKAFKTKHRVIADKFFTGYGKRLQFFDSIIAEDIMLVLNRLGIACLPVHDSFIVAYMYEQLLRAVMDIVFMFHVGQIAQIKKDKTVYDMLKSTPDLSDGDTIKYLEKLRQDCEAGNCIYSKYQQRKAEWYMANSKGACLITDNIQ